MAEIPDPDQHQINYFLAPGQSVRPSEIHEVAGKRQTDRQTDIMEKGKSFQAKHEIPASYSTNAVAENWFMYCCFQCFTLFFPSCTCWLPLRMLLEQHAGVSPAHRSVSG